MGCGGSKPAEKPAEKQNQADWPSTDQKPAEKTGDAKPSELLAKVEDLKAAIDSADVKQLADVLQSYPPEIRGRIVCVLLELGYNLEPIPPPVTQEAKTDTSTPVIVPEVVQGDDEKQQQPEELVADNPPPSRGGFPYCCGG
jgi:hypothetical protein